MSTNATQRQRLAELITPLGRDKLLLTSFTVHEEISQVFEIDIECISEDANIDFGQILGKSCTVRLTTVGAKVRYFSGVLVEASWFGEREGKPAYRMTLKPWFWLLTQTSDCKIFQNVSVVDIIKQVFADFSFVKNEFITTESYPAIEYCVQYRESSFSFVSRLMEKFGLYYYFKHDMFDHTIVIGDGRGSHTPVPDLPDCRFIGLGDRTRDNEEYVTTWLIGRSFQTGKVSLNAFDFKDPKANMLHAQVSTGRYAHDDLEVYDYPQKYKLPDKDDLGKKFAQARLFASQSMDQRRHATGNAPSLYPGGLTKIAKHPVGSENVEFLVVSATHTFMGELFSSGAEGDAEAYRGSYVLQLTDRPYKSPAVTPHPVISGPQTAMVVGPRSDKSKIEEIFTDKYGRIKVQFHWDRQTGRTADASRWVRVAQMWSGKAWGGIVIPRVGMEVVVEFIEGDPDRPIVVGTVYNGENGVPFTLPDNKTQSGLKTRSSAKGTDSHYNELVFEDKKDAEFVRLHAEKDLNATIEDAEKRIIKGKNKGEEGEITRETVIERGDDVLYVRGNHKTTVDADQELAVKKNQTVDVTKVISVTAGEKMILKVGQSTITLTPTAIEINTPNLKTKSMFTSINADVEIAEKAAIIKLN